MTWFLTFKGSWPWPRPWIRSYCIPSCITHRPLSTRQVLLKSKKLFVDGRTYGHLRSTLLGRLKRVDLKMYRLGSTCKRCRSWNWLLACICCCCCCCCCCCAENSHDKSSKSTTVLNSSNVFNQHVHHCTTV